MLQLNHVTISNKEKVLLNDCTYQFKEGSSYVIVGESDDFIAFFKCICDEKKADSGQVITWDGSEKFNSCDEDLMPEMLTVREYMSGLVMVRRSKLEWQEILENAGFDMSRTESLIRNLETKDRVILRFAAMQITDAYICVFGEPFPDMGLLSEWLRQVRDDKVVFFGTENEETARELEFRAEAEVVRLEDLR